MSNLLPQEEKNVLEREYKLKLAITANTLFLIIMVVVLVFIGVFIFLLKSEVRNLEENIELVSLNEEERANKQIVEVVNERLRIVNLDTHFLTPTDVIDLVLRNKNLGITITSFDFQSSLNSGSLQISGIAATREDLIAFFENLENENIVQTVDSPISNLSKSNNISFNADMTLINNEKEE